MACEIFFSFCGMIFFLLFLFVLRKEEQDDVLQGESAQHTRYSVFTPGESLSLLHFYSRFFYEYETLGTMFSLSVGHGKLGCDSCLSLRLNCMLSFFKEFDQRPKFSKT